MTEAELRKLEMENARKFREADKEELARPEVENFRLGTQPDWSLFNFILYCHDLRDYSDDMDLLRKFYERMYPHLKNFQKCNEEMKDILEQNFDILPRHHRKILKDILMIPSPFLTAQKVLKEAGERARVRAKSGIEIYRKGPQDLIK
jgi:hypothetical protein